MDRPNVTWIRNDLLEVDDTRFALANILTDETRSAMASGAMLLRKPRWLVEHYLDLAETFWESSRSINVVELGIYEGGSTALLSMLFDIRTLLAVDLTARSPERLAEHLSRTGRRSRVHACYGIDQASAGDLVPLLSEHFGSDPLDVVIDDASHKLEPSTVSFNLLFPRLRPGGLYIIEDWSSEHDFEHAIVEQVKVDQDVRAQIEEAVQNPTTDHPPPLPLSYLLFQLVLAAAYDSTVVSELRQVKRGWATISRGEATLDPGAFDIADMYGELGKRTLG